MEFTSDISLDMSVFKGMEKSVKQLNKRHIRFGWYEGKFYPASSNSGLSIAQVAYWQEYGRAGVGDTPSIPSRPYFRQSINIIKRSTNRYIADVFKTAIGGRDTTAKLQKMSDSFVGKYRASVASQNYKKLAPYTVALKGNSFQMIDSGVMVSNFKSRVYRQSQSTIKDS